jgi:serine protease Do
MTSRSFLFCIVLTVIFPFHVFSQQSSASASGLRDYVGVVNQTYHPGIVSFWEKIKADHEKLGNTDIVRIIDIFLSGSFGSGFVYSDARGNFYIITNNHVIEQAYTLSITFERLDGTKIKIEDLKIIATDEDADLAILAFPEGERPITQRGLTLLSRPVEEGEDVYSAGFPGLGVTPVWQFGRGMVSNAAARFPRSLSDDTLMGPFIQHTAQVDEGNSGGPLLVSQASAPSGYAVAGINTLSGLRRQAANYAVPAGQIQTFINGALNQRPETYRAELDQKLEKFIEGLSANRAVYPHIADFLSTACVGENAEYAMEEMSARAGRTVIDAFYEKIRESGVVGAMGYSVAWTIENSLRSGSTAIRASLKEVTGEGEEYTVVFTINNKDVSSVWIREYGNWRIKSFGDIARGDRSLVERRQTEREAAEKLKPGNFSIEAGYAILFNKRPAALYASFHLFNVGAHFYLADNDFWSLAFSYSFNTTIPAGNIGFIPYLRLGWGFFNDPLLSSLADITSDSTQVKETLSLAGTYFMGQVGARVTTSYVPGLFLGINFQYSLSLVGLVNDNVMKSSLCFTVGYAF